MQCVSLRIMTAAPIARVYAPNPVHRNRTAGKSQWRVPESTELGVFRHAVNEGWMLPDCGWGVLRHSGRLRYLGVARDHETRLFVAKFVDHARSGRWHGYPADHQRNPSDRPDPKVAARWLRDDIVPGPKLRKVLQGQPCRI